MSRDLTEMNKLEEYLEAHRFKYVREDVDNVFDTAYWDKLVDELGFEPEPMDIHQIVVYDGEVRLWDVICHKGSYGDSEGLLEGMGTLFGPDVEGYLTADDVINKIEAGGAA